MPIRLIDENATKMITISGTRFYLKQLNGANKARLAITMQPNERGDLVADIDALLPVLAKGVAKIEGFEEQSIEEVLGLMSDAADITRLAHEVVIYSTLSDDEVKNSSSLPGSNSQGGKRATARKRATNTTKGNNGSVSTTTTESPAKDQAERV